MINRIEFLIEKPALAKYIEEIQMPCFLKKVVSPDNVDDSLDILKLQTKSFSDTLLEFIDKKCITDVECYKRANIDRKLFSKIRSNVGYKPSKNTVLAFAIALKLTLKETDELLESAGYSLSHSFVSDIIVKYFIEKKKYNINLINLALDEYKQQPLGAK